MPDPDELKQRARAFRLLTGARLVFADGTPDIVVYPANRAGWGRLTRLLTIGNRRALKGECTLELSDLLAHAQDLLLIVIPPTLHRYVNTPAVPPAHDITANVKLRLVKPERGLLETTLARLAEVAPDASGSQLRCTGAATIIVAWPCCRTRGPGLACR